MVVLEEGEANHEANDPISMSPDLLRKGNLYEPKSRLQKRYQYTQDDSKG
jgi:hypothetical protein